eukprot:Lankesteria_metandrocarpae@DN696_c0_g1_i2.p1
MRALLVVCGFYWCDAVNPLSPVIMIPGIAGTGLFASFDNVDIPECGADPISQGLRRMWLSVTEVLPPLPHQLCWIAKMSMEIPQCKGGDADSYSKSPSGCPLVESGPESVYRDRNGTNFMPQGFPGTKGFEYLDYFNGVGVIGSAYFNKIAQGFRTAGYVDGESLFGFPYDWRLPFWQMDFGALKDLIEHAKAENKNRKVVLLSHSMGSLILSYFLNTQVDKGWKDEHIETFVSVSGAFGGSSSIIEALLTGFTEFFDVKLPGKVELEVIPSAYMRNFHRRAGSIFSLVPSPQVHGLNVRLVAQFPRFDDVLEPKSKMEPQGVRSHHNRSTTSTAYSTAAPVQQLQQQSFNGTDPAVHVMENNSLYDIESHAILEGQAEDMISVYTAANWSMLLPPNERALVEQAITYQNVALQDPEVPVYCFWSTSDKPNTHFNFAFDTDGTLLHSGFAKGDGSLALQTLRWCTYWESTTFTHEFNNLNHVGGLQNQGLIDMVISLVTGTR